MVLSLLLSLAALVPALASPLYDCWLHIPSTWAVSRGTEFPLQRFTLLFRNGRTYVNGQVETRFALRVFRSMEPGRAGVNIFHRDQDGWYDAQMPDSLGRCTFRENDSK